MKKHKIRYQTFFIFIFCFLLFFVLSACSLITETQLQGKWNFGDESRDLWIYTFNHGTVERDWYSYGNWIASRTGTYEVEKSYIAIQWENGTTDTISYTYENGTLNLEFMEKVD